MDIDGGLVAQALRGIGFAESHANAGGQVAVAFKNGDEDASTSEKYAIEILRALRGQVGEEAFAEWRSGILDSFQSPEVLRQAVHGIGVRRAAREEKVLVDDGALACPENMPEGALLHLWQDGPDGRSPQGRELAQQLARESGAPVPFLSQQSASFMQVRRITPLETERLQGFPDYWTAIEGRARVIDGPEADYLRFHGFPVEARANGKLYTTIAADGPRYKALGNSMAVNCMRWIGQRILAVDGILRENET